MKTAINNFCNNSPIEVEGVFYEEHGALVGIYQSGESMRFQHDLRPDQARELANALYAAAKHAEELQAGAA